MTVKEKGEERMKITERKNERGSVTISRSDGVEVYCTKTNDGWVVWKPKHLIHEEFQSLRKALRFAREAMDIERRIP